MSLALYPTGGVRFWIEPEIEFREMATQYIKRVIMKSLLDMNKAWEFQRVEGPILTPRKFVNAAYDNSDVFCLQQKLGEDDVMLRPETTASSFLYANHILEATKSKLPLCVWQAGKSFRVEKMDGASPSKLRYNEFWQAEFQCLYSKGTMADYRSVVTLKVLSAIELLTGTRAYPDVEVSSEGARLVESDRLPGYSTRTQDIEVPFNKRQTEMCSISSRTDFSDKVECLEIAIGLDRLVEVWSTNQCI